MAMSLQDASVRDAELVYHIKHEAYAACAAEAYGSWDEAFQRGFTRGNLRFTRLIVVDGEVVGWMAVDRDSPEIDLVDIHILPAHQRKGHGRKAIGVVLAEADAAGKAVSLGVLRNNPSRSLYALLGFAPVGETKTHVLMRRPNRPPDPGPAFDAAAAGQGTHSC